MDVAAKLALAVLLLGSLIGARAGPPPSRPGSLVLRSGLLFGGIVVYGLAALALASDAVVLGAVALVVASELMCVVGWLGRGEGPSTDDDDDSGGGGDHGPRRPPPVDWDAFEGAFARHVRERQPV